MKMTFRIAPTPGCCGDCLTHHTGGTERRRPRGRLPRTWVTTDLLPATTPMVTMVSRADLGPGRPRVRPHGDLFALLRACRRVGHVELGERGRELRALGVAQARVGMK